MPTVIGCSAQGYARFQRAHSAPAFGGKALRLLHMAIDRDLEIAVSQPIITEVLRALREKFGWRAYDIHAAKQRIEKTARVVVPSETLHIIATHGAARIVKADDVPRLIREGDDAS